MAFGWKIPSRETLWTETGMQVSGGERRSLGRMGSACPRSFCPCGHTISEVSSCFCQQHTFTWARGLHHTTHRVSSQALSAGRRLCCTSRSGSCGRPGTAASSCASEGPAQRRHRRHTRRLCAEDTARGRPLPRGPLRSVSFSVIQTSPVRCHRYLVSPHSWAGGGDEAGRRVSGSGSILQGRPRSAQASPGAPARHSRSSFWLKPRTPFDVLGLEHTPSSFPARDLH